MKQKIPSFALGLLIAAGAYAQPMAPDKVHLKANIGNVTFGHQIDVKNLGGQCRTCHHMHQGTGPAQTRHTRHQKKAMATIPSSQDAIHKNCQKCPTGKEKVCMLGPRRRCGDRCWGTSIFAGRAPLCLFFMIKRAQACIHDSVQHHPVLVRAGFLPT